MAAAGIAPAQKTLLASLDKICAASNTPSRRAALLSHESAI
jgi:hypothetical protein